MPINTIVEYRAAADAIRRFEEIQVASQVLQELLVSSPDAVLPVSIGTGSTIVSISARLSEFVPLLQASAAARQAEVEALGLTVS